MSDNITQHDLQSALAVKLRTHIDEKLLSLRAKNDGDLDATATAKLRGELKAYRNLKDLLALVKQPDPVEGADDE